MNREKLQSAGATSSMKFKLGAVPGVEVFETLNSKSDERAAGNLEVNLRFTNVDHYHSTALRRIARSLPQVIDAVRQEDFAERVKGLAKAYRPVDGLADLHMKAIEDTYSVRNAFLRDVPVLTSSETCQLVGQDTKSSVQMLRRWRKQGKLLGVTHGGEDLYPAFQFDRNGKLLPIVAEVLFTLNKHPARSDWDNAIWFLASSEHLNGMTPMDCLRSDPDAVRLAAQHEALYEE